MLVWQTGFITFLRVSSQILTAGVAITAFALLLYALSFNLRDRVARSFAVILACVVVVFTAESLGSTAIEPWLTNLWLRLQWVGIIFLPPAYLHFSDSLLTTTGQPSRGRRRFAVRMVYIASFLLLILLPTNILLGPVVLNQPPAPHLRSTLLTDFFTFYYLVIMGLSWFNFARAYLRTTTPTSRRRMAYLVIGALAPALGSFPYLLFGSNLASRHQITFWAIVFISNLLVGALIVIMAYSTAFFGVAWPDRVVKSRLFKWIMRGPVTAILTLAVATIVRRAGETIGFVYTALVPIAMAATILLSEFLITLFAPLGEKWLFYGKDREELGALNRIGNLFLSRNDLRQFLETILAAVCDRLQAPGAYLVTFYSDEPGMVISTGRTFFENESEAVFTDLITRSAELPDLFRWQSDSLMPLRLTDTPDGEILGLMGVSGTANLELDDDQRTSLLLLSNRASQALRERQTQQRVIQNLQSLSPEANRIQQMRAASRYDGTNLLQEQLDVPTDMAQWIKEALTHYWGGPKLTSSPLMRLKVVRDALSEHDGSQANALRSILRKAIEEVRPEGERRFTADWILYNILELKFVEGRKVREVAMRLSMSEADLYRKQKVALEAMAKAILEMENGSEKGG